MSKDEQLGVFLDACKRGDIDQVEKFLGFPNKARVKAFLTTSDNVGWTALHTAAFYGKKAIVERLLEQGKNERGLVKAMCRHKNNSDRTAVEFARARQFDEIAAILEAAEKGRAASGQQLATFGNKLEKMNTPLI